MEPKTKKRLSYLVIAFYFLLCGVEYAVILPTAWLYLNSTFHSQPYMLGLLMSAFCFSGLFAGPLMGRWCDKTGRTKLIFLFANFWEIAGNIMYFIGLSDWFLVASRLVAGVGTGIASALLADISRVTTSEERTSVLSSFMAMRQVGLVIGPGCNLFLREIHFSIAGFSVNPYNIPGLFMAVVWSLLQLLVLCVYTDLPQLFQEVQAAAITQQMEYDYSHEEDSPELYSALPHEQPYSNGPVTPKHTRRSRATSHQRKRSWPPYNVRTPARNHSLDPDAYTSSSEWIESAEQWIGAAHETPATPNTNGHTYGATGSVVSNGGHLHNFANGSEGSIPTALERERGHSDVAAVGPVVIRDGRSVTQSSSRSGNPGEDQPDQVVLHSWRYYYEEFMREEVIVLLAVVFMSFFAQLSLETMLTPLTKALFDWGELENSLIYFAAGVEIILIFIGIRFLSKRFEDRQLLLFGLVVELVSNAYYLWFLPQAQPGQSSLLPGLIVGVFVNLLGLPFLFVTSVSLYSKVTNAESQGFGQGLRRLSGGLGNLLGPLWAGSLIPEPYVGGSKVYLLMGVLTALMFIGLAMLLLSYKKLKESNDTLNSSSTLNSRSAGDDERRPLLSPVNRSIQ